MLNIIPNRPFSSLPLLTSSHINMEHSRDTVWEMIKIVTNHIHEQHGSPDRYVKRIFNSKTGDFCITDDINLKTVEKIAALCAPQVFTCQEHVPHDHALQTYQEAIWQKFPTEWKRHPNCTESELMIPLSDQVPTYPKFTDTCQVAFVLPGENSVCCVVAYRFYKMVQV